jgi:F-type H+-transporting ATPase subunit gamma
VIAEIAGRIKCNKVGGIDNRCFIENNAPEVIDIIFVTADKGLCGGFNMQTIKAVKRLIKDYKNKNVKIRLRGIGKKGIEFFSYNQVEMLDEVKNLSSAPDMQRSSEFMTRSINDFKDGVVDAVYIVYNGYLNVITQELHINRILPVNVDGYDCDENKNTVLELEAQDEEKMLDSLVTKSIRLTQPNFPAQYKKRLSREKQQSNDWSLSV